MPKTSIEQRLYEAYRSGNGLRLSAEDVVALVHDDAVATRITNRAASDAGIEEPGCDMVFRACGERVMTWKRFKEWLRSFL